jgi:hypothetical protein
MVNPNFGSVLLFVLIHVDEFCRSPPTSLTASFRVDLTPQPEHLGHKYANPAAAPRPPISATRKTTVPARGVWLRKPEDPDGQAVKNRQTKKCAYGSHHPLILPSRNTPRTRHGFRERSKARENAF